MHPQEGSLLHLAGAVADGSDIDWDRAESSADEGVERDVIRQLRQLAIVRAAARAQDVSWGALQIRGEVGKGAFGTVYRAWDTRLEREVALKLLEAGRAASSASTVIKEGRLLAQIRHPNVVTVHGADAFDGRVGIWMEFVTGRTLKEIVSAQGPFGAHEAALIGRDLCRALAAVHKAGFLHRDIKAQNVMREAGGRTVLMDFGAGEDVSAAVQGSPLSGTPAYLAPELLAGGTPSVQSDLYSLGVLLYFLVSGEFPVVASSLADFRARHADGRRRLLRDIRPDLPASFVRVIDRATAANPAERPESAGALEALLGEALEVAEGARSALRWGAGRRVAAAAAGVLALAGAVWIAGAPMPWRARPVPRNSSVAVLPFKNLTPGTDTEYFSDGITADLVAHLAALPDLRIIWGASVLPYEDRQKSVNEIGEELGVATVLDGSVRQEGGRVRIVSQLLDAASGEQLWSESFDRDVQDISAMQSEVSRKIALALKGELSERDMERLGSRRPRDFQAFDLYLKGRYYWELRTEEGMTRSLQYFQEAARRDPDFAPAYAGMADAYAQLGVYGFLPRSDAFTRAEAEARRAISLDDSLAEAHASLGYIAKNAFQWQQAEASFRRALELKPGYATAHHWYSIHLTQQGRFSEAITEIKLGISVDPLSIGANGQLASVLLMARRYDDAIAQFERVLQMDANAMFAHRGRAHAYTYKGDYAQALSAIEDAGRAASVGAEGGGVAAEAGYVMALAGRGAEALRIARELEERHRLTAEPVGFGVASIYAALGRRDDAFGWLTRASATREPDMGYLKVEPRWDPLRGDPRFGQLLESLGFSQ